MKTILIIEDDIVFSRSISNWLVKKGMKTECVATLANARKAIGQKEFDLILADLRLPDGNSTSLLKWMNEKYYSIPFLIMTNYGQVENAVTTMQLGAINYLCKPVLEYPWPGNIRELKNVIGRAVLICQEQWISVSDLNLEISLPKEEETQWTEEEKEKALLLQTLEKTGDNRSKAARLLNVSRTTLYEKLRKYHIID